MDLELYNNIKRDFIGFDKSGTDVDFFDETIQKKIENYDRDIGLREEILDRIKKYLKDYNKYLQGEGLSTVNLRYYQILALYFTEAYLQNLDKEAYQDFAKNSLAYWMATGSGKTIIMHLNIFQFIEHKKGFKELELIVTTPGVNLINQHEREIIPLVEYLNKIHRNKIKLTIDTTSYLLNRPKDFFKFPDDKKYQRLILVDEAHIGLGGTQSGDEGEFKKLRKELNIKHSFLFEYSATFHNISAALQEEYGKSIIYDYNYNHFYRDGYGKDFYFQKVSSDVLRNDFNDNLEHNLKVIENKLKIFNSLDYSKVQSFFNASRFPDKPLIAFMGNTVNDKKKEGKDDEVSDLSGIVKYFADLSPENRRKFSNLFNGEYTGNLRLTRNPNAEDEILMSYGEGDYWGIINVGNGLNFINNQDDSIEKRTGNNIVITDNEKYMFENIDKKESPINILLGSRKFAEGWNCFRVSVIGLVNLGVSKGNKIIQIFGRGVRLKGLNNDGKRYDKKHIEDYFALEDGENDDDIKKLETLCVFSLTKSYLETFTESIRSELDITKTYDIKVDPSLLIIKGNEETFESYSKEINIFKLSKTSIDVKQVILNGNNIKYQYLFDGKVKTGEINNFTFSLDYSIDYNKKNIQGILRNAISKYNAFINYSDFNQTLIQTLEESNLQLYVMNEDSTVRFFNANDMLNFINAIWYKENIDEMEFEFIENIFSILAEEFVKKIKNKINWHLNSSNYSYNEPLKQSTVEEKGDFIDKYEIVKSFKLSKDDGKPKSDKILEEEINKFTETIIDIEEKLKIKDIGNHIYNPLLYDDEEILVDGIKLKPDKLNKGERKFVNDLAEYVRQYPEKFDGYDIYLMRNVESLKSIGIYMNSDSEVFYPDFVLWLVGKDKVYINFIDPKGQMGLKDLTKEEYKEKIDIADKSKNETLSIIEKELKKIYKKEFILNSFIILRDTSDLGKSMDSDWKKENMIKRNIFRLNWHEKNEDGDLTDRTTWVDEKSYLDWMVEKTI